jgi:hypothetical protein
VSEVWSADATVSVDYQRAILRWLERLGVPAPADEQMIARVSVRADGDGTVYVERYADFPPSLRKAVDVYPLAEPWPTRNGGAA